MKRTLLLACLLCLVLLPVLAMAQQQISLNPLAGSQDYWYTAVAGNNQGANATTWTIDGEVTDTSWGIPIVAGSYASVNVINADADDTVTNVFIWGNYTPTLTGAWAIDTVGALNGAVAINTDLQAASTGTGPTPVMARYLLLTVVTDSDAGTDTITTLTVRLLTAPSAEVRR